MRWAHRGFFAVSINYRLLGGPSCRGYDFDAIEASGTDAKAAIRFVQAQAQAWNIDPTKVFLMGCSAGARTSLWSSFVDGNGIGGSSSQANPEQSAAVAATVVVSAELYHPHTASSIVHFDNPVMVPHGANDDNTSTPFSTGADVYQRAVSANQPAELHKILGGYHCPYDQVGSVCSFVSMKALYLPGEPCLPQVVPFRALLFP